MAKTKKMSYDEAFKVFGGLRSLKYTQTAYEWTYRPAGTFLMLPGKYEVRFMYNKKKDVTYIIIAGGWMITGMILKDDTTYIMRVDGKRQSDEDFTEEEGKLFRALLEELFLEHHNRKTSEES